MILKQLLKEMGLISTTPSAVFEQSQQTLVTNMVLAMHIEHQILMVAMNTEILILTRVCDSVVNQVSAE